MPNKTIYVSDADIPLFQRAQQLAGGNISAAITKAVRIFVSQEESESSGYEQVTLWVGKPGKYRAKRFNARPIVHWNDDRNQRRQIRYTVYLTAGGRYAVYQEDGVPPAPWMDPAYWLQKLSDMQSNWHKPHPAHPYSWSNWNWQGFDCDDLFADEQNIMGSSLRVFESLDELRDSVPSPVAERVEHSGQKPPVEDLDI